MSKRCHLFLTNILAKRLKTSSTSWLRNFSKLVLPHTSSSQHNGRGSESDKTKYDRRISHYFMITALLGTGYTAWKNRKRMSTVLCEVGIPSEKHENQMRPSEKLSLPEAVKQSEQLLKHLMLEYNCPGLVVTVTIDGKEAWSEGFGLADVENGIQCSPATVMRVASISKPLTMAAAAKLWEEKKLDLDRPIHDYVTSWPEKFYKGEKVTISVRQLVSMLGGIRNYDKECKSADQKKSKHKKKKDDKKDSNIKDSKEKDKKENQMLGKDKKSKPEFDHKEYYLKKRYSSVSESLEIFKADELCSLPGSEYLYSTYSWTLVSAAIEAVSGKKFPDIMKQLFRDLGLENTYLDDPLPLVYNRARYYVTNKRGQLTNAPYVDNSYKWAGGGYLSTSHDLCKFGNAMLYSFQLPSTDENARGYLRPETMKMIWSPVSNTKCSWDRSGFYGMGWGTIPSAVSPAFCGEQRQYFSHTGGAVGASSVLLILPRDMETRINSVADPHHPPFGIVVAIIVNMQSVGMNRLALDIAKLFEKVDYVQ